MKLSSICILFFAVFTSSVSRADEAMDWSGFYLGAYAAGSKLESEKQTEIKSGYLLTGGGGAELANALPALMRQAAISDNGQNISPGIYGGYLWHQGQLAFGFEADYLRELKLGSSLKVDRNVTGLPGRFGYEHYNDLSVSNLMSLRGRAGYVNEDWMLYLSGGVARGEVKDLSRSTLSYTGSHSMLLPETVTERSSSQTGYILGVGGEYRLSENLRLRAEFMYLNLGKGHYANEAKTLYGPTSGPPVGSTFVYGNETGTRSLKASTVRVGLSYSF